MENSNLMKFKPVGWMVQTREDEHSDKWKCEYNGFGKSERVAKDNFDDSQHFGYINYLNLFHRNLARLVRIGVME